MFSLRYFCKLGFMCPSDAAFIFSFFVYAARAKTVQPRHRLRFHGLMRLRHRNSGLCPSDSLAATAPFVSWNGAIASDGLPMPSPCRIRKCMINSNITPGTLPCTNPNLSLYDTPFSPYRITKSTVRFVYDALS